jgi:hypothetical protein
MTSTQSPHSPWTVPQPAVAIPQRFNRPGGTPPPLSVALSVALSVCLAPPVSLTSKRETEAGGWGVHLASVEGLAEGEEGEARAA